MIVGFTGSRKQITVAQQAMLRDFLKSLGPIRAPHHGDASGSDAAFHEICRELGIPLYIHPPVDPKHRAFCQTPTQSFPEKDYLARNKDIVEAANLLLATPRGFHETRRSGTWATVRFAQKRKIPITIIFPDGTISQEGRGFSSQGYNGAF